MPKIARQNVSAQHSERVTTGLKSYFCCCREFALVIDRSLERLARRRTDGAYILRNEASDTAKKTTYKLNATTDAVPVLIRRDGNALEKQWRMRCTRCDLILGYQVREPKAVKQRFIKQAPFTYLLSGALTDQQQTLPPEVFDIEPWKGVREREQASTPTPMTTEKHVDVAALNTA